MDLEILDISNLDWNDNERVEKLGIVSNKILMTISFDKTDKTNLNYNFQLVASIN